MINSSEHFGKLLVTHSIAPDKLYQSIPEGANDGLWFVFNHGTSKEVAKSNSSNLAGRESIIFNYRTNRGLAKSWNEGIVNGQSYGYKDFLMLNDDLFFYPGGYEKFIAYAKSVVEASPNVGMITMLGNETGAGAIFGNVQPQFYSCSFLTRHAIAKIGLFDENITPAYFEDTDYEARMKRAGLTRVILQEVLVEHERSSTRQANPEIAQQLPDFFEKNCAYFMKKWGDRGENLGVFDHPFDDPSIGFYISAADRHDPYPSKHQI